MKDALFKIGLTTGTAIGILVAGMSPVKAAIIQPADPNIIAPDSPGPVCDFTNSIACSGLVGGTDDLTKLRSFLDELNDVAGFESINPNAWGQPTNFDTDGANFLARINQPNTTPDEGFIGINPIFSVTYDSGARRSGTWMVNRNRTGFTPFVLALKAGPNVTFNYFDGNSSNDFFGNWDTSRLPSGGPNSAGFSHATLWVPSDLVGIPTPAMLPGLIGLGVAALRKKKDQDSEADT